MERCGLNMGLWVGSVTEESTPSLMSAALWRCLAGEDELSKSHPVFVLVVNTCPSIHDHVGSGTAGVRQMVYCLQLSAVFSRPSSGRAQDRSAITVAVSHRHHREWGLNREPLPEAQKRCWWRANSGADSGCSPALPWEARWPPASGAPEPGGGRVQGLRPQIWRSSGEALRKGRRGRQGSRVERQVTILSCLLPCALQFGVGWFACLFLQGVGVVRWRDSEC